MNVPKDRYVCLSAVFAVKIGKMAHEGLFVEKVKELTTVELDGIDQVQSEIGCWQW